MWEAPSTWRARMWPIEPRFFSAEYNGLIAAPGTPKAQVTPSFSKIRTAASIARILAISRLADVAGRDDHGNDRRSQRNRFCFPRCGMIAEKGRGIRQLDRPHNETMGLPAFALAIKRAKLPPTG